MPAKNAEHRAMNKPTRVDYTFEDMTLMGTRLAWKGQRSLWCPHQPQHGGEADACWHVEKEQTSARRVLFVG